MVIDIVFFIMMVMAVFKGISRGLIVAVFSFLAFIIGLAAAVKLSSVVAAYLHQHTKLSGAFLPVLSFIIVFIGIVFIVRWGAAIIKKMASLVFLGWLDAVGGILLYVLLYVMILSVIFFYAAHIGLISDEMKADSKTFGYIEPFAPKVMSILGSAIPFFSNMFADLKNFFGGIK